jgi:hypothetical protein
LNRIQHSGCIGHHFIVPEPHDPVAELRQIAVSSLVPADIDGMLPAIQLNDQLCRRTEEINDERTDRLLAPELQPAQSPAP